MDAHDDARGDSRATRATRALALVLALLAACTGPTPRASDASGGESRASGGALHAPAPAGAPPDASSVPALAPLTEYMGRSIAQTMHWTGAPWLLRESREAEEASASMLAALGVERGSTVCDLGCGNGYHTLELARAVGPSGRVLAVDIQPEMLVMLEERARDASLANVEPILGAEHDPRLPAASCDLVLMVDVYHELGYPEQVLRAVREALRPGGALVLVEFRAEDERVPIKPEHKMSKAQIERELAANGFRLARSHDALPWQHMLFFEAR